MFRSILLLCGLMLSAASATTYGESVREQSLGGGRYLVTTSANEFNEPGDAYHFAFARAQEICPSGFNLLDQDGTAMAQSTPPGGDLSLLWPGWPAHEKHQVALVIECIDAPRETAARPGRPTDAPASAADEAIERAADGLSGQTVSDPGE